MLGAGKSKNRRGRWKADVQPEAGESLDANPGLHTRAAVWTQQQLMVSPVRALLTPLGVRSSDVGSLHVGSHRRALLGFTCAVGILCICLRHAYLTDFKMTPSSRAGVLA